MQHNKKKSSKNNRSEHFISLLFRKACIESLD